MLHSRKDIDNYRCVCFLVMAKAAAKMNGPSIVLQREQRPSIMQTLAFAIDATYYGRQTGN
jgi:hypothetical protein